MIVTRFAPSPTGYLHIGGARTALFNWLFARNKGGRFILRIEDTDQKRNTPTAIKQVMDDLRWLGIQWDEGPEVDGPNAPYLQSQRLDIYRKYVKKLLGEGKAYYCFETAEELQVMRKQAEAQKKGFVYPRPKKFPGEADVKKAEAEGRPATVRFAMPLNEDIVVEDLVRGEVKFKAGEFADFIILKSDGFPTYHFACVVDDELMKVTHVIRGQEHLMNTPVHIALQLALGFQTPIYAHMSVTVSDDGGKLSKRERPKSLLKAIKAAQEIDLELLAKAGGISLEELEAFIKGEVTLDMPIINSMAECLGVDLPEINVVDFFNSGYLPETMVNFLALLGWNPGDEREVMTVEELTNSFDISRLTKSNSLFDRKKLLSFNTEHIRIMDSTLLLEHFKAYLKQVDSPIITADDGTIKKLLKINQGARTLADIEQKSRFLFIDNDKVEYNEKAVAKVLLKHDGLAILRTVKNGLVALEGFTEQGIEEMLRKIAQDKQVGLGKVAQPLRVAICGDTVSPPIFDSVNMLGIESTLQRIDITLNRFETDVKAERS
ncbi:MAG: glutamate--tRNA ligase [Planctomycetota bacterium]|jgi:glutamyl-tRNA synthetase